MRFAIMKKLFFAMCLAVCLCACTSGSGSSEPRKIRINVDMSVSPENRAALMDNLLRLAEASRGENGCIGYEIYENSRDSSRVLIVETWESAAALEAHQQTDHFKSRAPKNKELSSSSDLLKLEF